MTEIHERLAGDCIRLGRLQLSHLLLMNDSNYPWFILVPARDGIREIYQLETGDRRQLLDESCALSEFIMRSYKGDKLNLAALGNQVPQLHLHHIVRYASDPAWPAPIWGRHPLRPYSASAINQIRNLFSGAGLAGYVAAADE